ncbi:hypothetical protein MTO96_023797 [Rhipicephalus appendiculatus]
MEVDSGSTYSIISDATARRIFPNGCVPNLQPLHIIMRDYQANRIAVRGIGTVRVQFKDFDGQLCLVIVKGKRPSLLGLDWFPALGIDITGVQHIHQLPSSLDSIFKDFAPVFDETLGCYKGPPVHFALNPDVVPIRLEARRVPFALRPKIDAELDKLVQQGILEPVHAIKPTASLYGGIGTV